MNLRKTAEVVGGVAAVAAMLAGGALNFLILHSLVETFSAVIAMAVFLLAWNSRRLLEDRQFLVRIGIVLLFVGGIDVVHALAYRGMGVFAALVPGGDTVNLATQLWIVGRLLFAAALPVALFLPSHAVRPPVLLAAMAAVTATLTVMVFTGAFPPCFVPGRGLTPFKIGAEIAICLTLAAGGALLWRKRTRFDPRLVKLVGRAIVLSIASELCFMIYADPYALANSLGHVLKLAAYVMLYRALVQLGLREPYAVLFRGLKEHEAALAEANRSLESRVADRTEALERRQAQLRFLARELTLVERKERRRLATLLHDELAQILVAARMRLATVRRSAIDQRNTEVETLSDLLEDALTVTRELIAELVPHRLDTGTLLEAVRSMADDTACRYGARVEVAAQGDLPTLPLECRETAFNAVRELVVNAAKHSGAPSLRVTLRSSRDGSLVALVEDDGTGFDPASLDSRPDTGGGFGLLNVREQIDLIGGEFRIASARGTGTRAEVVVPPSYPAQAS